MYEHFTSLTPEEERDFVVYEQRSRESAKKASMVGWASAGAFLLIVLIAVIATPKPKSHVPEAAPAAAAPATPPATPPPAATDPAAAPAPAATDPAATPAPAEAKPQ